MKKLTTFLLTLFLITLGASAQVDYSSKMSNAKADWYGATNTYSSGVERYDAEVAVNGTTPVPVLCQTITGLPAGTYEVTFYAVANNAWVGAAVGEGIAQVFANETTKDVEVYDQTSFTDLSAYSHTLTCTVGVDGLLVYGLQNVATGGNWYVAQGVSLTLTEASSATLEAGDVLHSDVAGIGHWLTTGNNGTFVMNDWSVETDASGMKTPFCQNWAWIGEDGTTTLTAATISHATFENLPAGTYEVSMDIRIFSEAGNAIGTGTTFNANGVSEDLASGADAHADVYGTETEVYGTYVLSATVGDAGTLDISINIPDGATYNWIAWKNLSVTYVGEAEEEEPGPEEPTDIDSDYHTGDVITVGGVDYTVLGENLVPNHSFELGFTGWTNASDFSTEITSSKFDLRTDGAEDGEQYLVGTTNSGSTSDGSLGTAWAIEANKIYYFFYWVKNLDGTEETDYLKTSLTNTPGTETVELGYPASVSADWQKVEYVFDSESYAYVQVKFRWLENHWGFDNFQLYEVEAPEIEPVVAEGEYLIVNAEGNYLGGGLSWGTQAAIIGKPQFIGFEVQKTNGTYHLDSHQYDSESKHYLGSNLYFDNATPVDWTIAAVEGGYTIYGTVNDGTGYLTSNGFQELATVEETPYVWTLVTMDDVVASMADATEEAPVDVTALIKAPELKRNSNREWYPTWTVTGYDGTGTPSNYAFGSSSAVASCAESYHSSNGFNFSQEITLPLAGTYTLSAQGFYRDDNSTTLLLPVMYAGDDTSEFTALSDTTITSMALAYQAFLEGSYPVEAITITAETDGETVTIGFKGEDTSLWNIMGELTLLYSGAEAVEPEPESSAYVFVCTDWGSIDLGRVTDDNVTYDETNNTITVVASGTNNVALSNGREAPFTTANMTVTNKQCWYTVVGTNISTASGDSKLWWMNGANWGEWDPTSVVELDDGQVLVTWDLSTMTEIDVNLQGEENYLDGWTGFGITSTTGTSVISDINFYTKDEVDDIISGVATRIDTVETAVPVEDGAIYDLSGRKVAKAVKGVYIINGKKVLVK